MITHQMKLAAEPFEKIAHGHKVIESRLFDEKRQKINIGDHIEFSSNDDLAKKIVVRVKALYQYGSFDDLFSDFPPEYFGGVSKKELGEKIHNIYTSEEEQQYGVVGIKIKLL